MPIETKDVRSGEKVCASGAAVKALDSIAVIISMPDGDLEAPTDFAEINIQSRGIVTHGR